VNGSSVTQSAKVIPMPLRRDAVRIHCRQTGCRFVATARTEGQAVRAIGQHIVIAHYPQMQMPKGAA
jgi:hypothetical protein